MKPLGEAASELSWLMPSAASLIALARPEPAWQQLRRDPAAVLLLLRAGVQIQGPLTGDAPTITPATLPLALTLLAERSMRFIDWSETAASVYRHALGYAALAQSLAASLPRCDAERAWIAGLLAPLGWLAICAAQPESAEKSLRDFTRFGRQSIWQHENWGLDHAALVRRLCRAWNLPAWLSSIIGHLGLPVDIAVNLQADPLLFQIVQLAVALEQRDDAGLALPLGSEIGALLRALDLSSSDVERIVRGSCTGEPNRVSGRCAHSGPSRGSAHQDNSPWKVPGKRQLLMELLRTALETNSQRKQVIAAESSQRKQGNLESNPQRESSGCDLQAQKMAALAELAAGAGHEINNPLAVISGQAQYIARRLEQAQSLIPEEPSLEEYLTTLRDGIAGSLKTIRSQSQRIHHVLTSLMQFARPTQPQPVIVTVRELLRESMAMVQDLAVLRKVRLDCQDVPDSWRVHIDPAQTRTALVCLLRNGVEAAPPEGWAGLRVEKTGDNHLKVMIEDNGPGILPGTLEHMFDPFFSGRSAGRGQGLGLPIAWQLARQQGGDVVFNGHMDGVTRFTLSLPGLESGYCTSDAATPHTVAQAVA